VERIERNDVNYINLKLSSSWRNV